MRFGIKKTLIGAMSLALVLPAGAAFVHAGELTEEAEVSFVSEYEEYSEAEELVEETNAEESDIITFDFYSVGKYSISYELNGGKNNSKNPSSYKVNANTITLLEPTRKGYIFEGWYSDSDYTEQVEIIEKGSTGDKTLYAKWTAKEYEITYELKGGENHSDNPSFYTKETAKITLKKPSKDGYKFKGWYSDKKYKKQAKTIDKGSTGAKTFYAKWEKEKYTIKYDLNGGKNNSKNPSKYTITTAAIELQKPTRSGYTFKGWYTDSEFTEESKVTSIEQGSFGDKLLYARWEIKKYDITYHLNEGTNHEENPSVYTIKNKVTLKEPTKDGYTFAGWYTNKKLTKKINTIKKGSKGDLDLYAKWTVSPIGTVKVPENYLSVCDPRIGAIPNDGKDDTAAFQKALYFVSIDGYWTDTVYVPEGVYDISATDPYSRDTGISVLSNSKLIMDNNAILNVKGNSKSDYAVIKALKANNITIQGGKIQGERYDHTGKKGESGHGISILGCKNVTISDMFISSNWGDGIYLGTWKDGATGKLTGNKKIKIRRCEITDNRRNNISIIDADEVTIDKCNISDAHGTAPQCGICIEPNKGSTSGDQICSDIVIKDTTISAYGNKNAMGNWCFMTTAYGSKSSQPSSWVTAKNIKFENCTFNGYVGNYSGNNLKVDKKTTFNGTFDSWRKYTKVN